MYSVRFQFRMEHSMDLTYNFIFKTIDGADFNSDD